MARRDDPRGVVCRRGALSVGGLRPFSFSPAPSGRFPTSRSTVILVEPRTASPSLPSREPGLRTGDRRLQAVRPGTRQNDTGMRRTPSYEKGGRPGRPAGNSPGTGAGRNGMTIASVRFVTSRPFQRSDGAGGGRRNGTCVSTKETTFRYNPSSKMCKLVRRFSYVGFRRGLMDLSSISGGNRSMWTSEPEDGEGSPHESIRRTLTTTGVHS